MPRATAAIVDPQFVDIVDFLTRHPDTVVTAHDYIAWPERDTDIDWQATEATPVVGRVQDRLDQLAVLSTIPARPRVKAHARDAVWLKVLVDDGAFYRTGNGRSGAYVLDTAAHWVSRQGSHGHHAELLGNRWGHTPAVRVRDAMGVVTVPPSTDSKLAAAARGPVVRGHRLVAINPAVGGDVVVEVVSEHPLDPDSEMTWTVHATVQAMIPKVDE